MEVSLEACSGNLIFFQIFFRFSNFEKILKKTFSLAQSAGAAGVGAATTAIMGAAGGTAAAGIAKATEDSENESQNDQICTCAAKFRE